MVRTREREKKYVEQQHQKNRNFQALMTNWSVVAKDDEITWTETKDKLPESHHYYFQPARLLCTHIQIKQRWYCCYSVFFVQMKRICFGKHAMIWNLRQILTQLNGIWKCRSSKFCHRCASLNEKIKLKSVPLKKMEN